MQQIENIILNDTLWGTEATKLNMNFARIQTAIQALEGSTVSSSVKSVNNISPDSNGNIKLTASSLNALDSSLLGAPNGVPKLDSRSKISKSYLDLPAGNKFAGIASLSTSPSEEQFYYAVSIGTYTNFIGSARVALEVTEADLRSNLVVLSYTSSGWKKLLVSLPSGSDSGTSAQVYWSDILMKPTFADVAISGNYSDLKGTPTLAAVATSGNYEDLKNAPVLAAVAISGKMSDLEGEPSSVQWTAIKGAPEFSKVATSGSYTDLVNVPTTVSWTSIVGAPEFKTVATSGKYSDLEGKPSLATVATTGNYNDLVGTADVLTVSKLNIPGGIPTLDSSLKLKESQIPSAVKNSQLGGYIGIISKGTDLSVYTVGSTQQLFGSIVEAGNFINLGLSFSVDEINNYIVFVLGRTTFSKILIPKVSAGQSSGVSSVNGMSGAIVLTPDTIGALAASELNAQNGVCGLDDTGRVSFEQLPEANVPNGLPVLDADGKLFTSVLPFSSNTLIGLVSDLSLKPGETYLDYTQRYGYVFVDRPTTAEETRLDSAISLQDLVESIVFIQVDESATSSKYVQKSFINSFESVALGRSQSSGKNLTKVSNVADLTLQDASSLLRQITPKTMDIAGYATTIPGLLVEASPGRITPHSIDLGALLAILTKTSKSTVDLLSNLWGTSADL